MEEQAKLLADLTAAVSSMKSKLDELHPAVLNLHTRKPEIARSVEPPVLDRHAWKPSIEKSMEALRAEVGDLRALILDPKKSASTSPTASLLGVRAAGEGVDGRRQFGGLVSTSDSSATSGASTVIHDTSLDVTIDVTGMATSTPTRCSTEGLTRDATESTTAISPAMAPVSLSTTDIISVHDATTASNGTLDVPAIFDATSLLATCSLECLGNDTSVSAMGAALFPSSTITGSKALEAVPLPPTAPTLLEEDHRPPWPPPQLAVVYQAGFKWLLWSSTNARKLWQFHSADLDHEKNNPPISRFSFDTLYSLETLLCMVATCNITTRDKSELQVRQAVMGIHLKVQVSTLYRFLMGLDPGCLSFSFTLHDTSILPWLDLVHLLLGLACNQGSEVFSIREEVHLPGRLPHRCYISKGDMKINMQTIPPKCKVVIKLLVWLNNDKRNLGTLLSMLYAVGEGELVTSNDSFAHCLFTWAQDMNQRCNHLGAHDQCSLYIHPVSHPSILKFSCDQKGPQLILGSTGAALCREYWMANIFDGVGSPLIAELVAAKLLGMFCRLEHWWNYMQQAWPSWRSHVLMEWNTIAEKNSYLLLLSWVFRQEELSLDVQFQQSSVLPDGYLDNQNIKARWHLYYFLSYNVLADTWRSRLVCERSDAAAIHLFVLPDGKHCGNWQSGQSAIGRHALLFLIQPRTLNYVDYRCLPTVVFTEILSMLSGRCPVQLEVTSSIQTYWVLSLDPGDFLVHHVICPNGSYVAPCLASGIVDKIASSYEIVLGKEFYAPWDPGGHVPQVFDEAGLRASRMLRRGECHGPCGLLYRVPWAAMRRDPQAQGRREEQCTQLYLKGIQDRTGGGEELEPETENPGKGGGGSPVS